MGAARTVRNPASSETARGSPWENMMSTLMMSQASTRRTAIRRRISTVPSARSEKLSLHAAATLIVGSSPCPLRASLGQMPWRRVREGLTRLRHGVAGNEAPDRGKPVRRTRVDRRVDDALQPHRSGVGMEVPESATRGTIAMVSVSSPPGGDRRCASSTCTALRRVATSPARRLPPRRPCGAAVSHTEVGAAPSVRFAASAH